MIKNLIRFIQLTRPLFLLGGVILYALGAVFALTQGYPINGMSFIIGQLTVTSVQLMTHYLNEYYDLESDAVNQARTWFSGGSGVLSSGTFSPRLAWKISVFLAIAAAVLILTIGLTMPFTALICVLSLGLSWFYSAPPLRLCATGAGELSASLVVTLLVPWVGYSLQAGGKTSPDLLILCIPLFLLHFAMLIAFQIPDYIADKAVGKKTIAVRLGLQRAIWLHNLLLILAYCTAGLLILTHWQEAAMLFIPFPLALWQFLSIRRYGTNEYQGYLALTMRAIAIFAATATIYLAAYLII